MTDLGQEARMRSLLESAERDVLSLLRTHHWDAVVERQEPGPDLLVIKAERAGCQHRVAVLYTTAIDNKTYKRIEPEVDAFLASGGLYKLESYAYGVKKPIVEIKQFVTFLMDWNAAAAPGKIAPSHAQPSVTSRSPRRDYALIQSEEPLRQIWQRLNHLASVTLARRTLEEKLGPSVAAGVLTSKAEGLAFAVRNASDYFRGWAGQTLSQRVVNMYYGTLAFAFAELLSSRTAPSTIDEVENMTKRGHGLYMADAASAEFADLVVGALSQGFFPRYAEFLGKDVSHYCPSSRKPTSADELSSLPESLRPTLEQLFARIPEVSDLYRDVFPGPSRWFRPVYDDTANGPSLAAHRAGVRKTYVRLIDPCRRATVSLVATLPGPISQIEEGSPSNLGTEFRVLIDHPNDEYWHGALPLHHSPFAASALIEPLFGNITEFRATALVLLYGLSIVVRYRPGVWRRIQEGSWDHYKVLTGSFLDVVERVLPEEYLSAILGVRVHAKQPGSLW